jgi:hypothetical protein
LQKDIPCTYSGKEQFIGELKGDIIAPARSEERRPATLLIQAFLSWIAYPERATKKARGIIPRDVRDVTLQQG